MKKPFVVCHMFTSMDGKIDGAFMPWLLLPLAQNMGTCGGFTSAKPRYTAL